MTRMRPSSDLFVAVFVRVSELGRGGVQGGKERLR